MTQLPRDGLDRFTNAALLVVYFSLCLGGGWYLGLVIPQFWGVILVWVGIILGGLLNSISYILSECFMKGDETASWLDVTWITLIGVAIGAALRLF